LERLIRLNFHVHLLAAARQRSRSLKILAIERELLPAGSGVSDQPHLVAEAARLWELYQGGVVREMYFRADAPLAVLVLECDNLRIAGEAVATLPLVRHGLIAFDLSPCDVSRLCPPVQGWFAWNRGAEAALDPFAHR